MFLKKHLEKEARIYISSVFASLYGSLTCNLTELQ